MMKTTSKPNNSSAKEAYLARLGGVVAKRRRNFLARKVAGVCRRYLGWYENHRYELQSNGECFVLDTLARFRPRVIFDVGANVGEWSVAAVTRCPGATIYAFEVAPPTFEVLRQNLCHRTDVRCHNVGLSDAPGQIRLRHYDDLPALTTATDYPHPLPFTELTAEVITGDDFVAANQVEHIDLLKIDVEGMEEHVLRGFESGLRRGAIDLVQFEYGRVNILNRFLLRDFYTFFAARGYVVGKIFPNYVDFRDYQLDDENFLGPNYLACLRARAEYLRALGSGALEKRQA